MPALAVAQNLHDLGATVTDPRALDNACKTHPDLDYIDDPIAAVQDADFLLHLVEWPQYSHIDPYRLATRAATAELSARPEGLTEAGFVRDYGDLDAFKKWLDDTLDHRHLNDAMRVISPSVENMALWIYSQWSEKYT
ncbi:6-carboxytetrahydropterin synthase [Streptomyces atriruber]|uniref:6-carboxy-5,6,7,8-tetrahydropterin synthase n=1 Tax=Streptomyces atriruber TaxID=545121 RepID=A0ABV3BX18_9ACTN